VTKRRLGFVVLLLLLLVVAGVAVTASPDAEPMGGAGSTSPRASDDDARSDADPEEALATSVDPQERVAGVSEHARHSRTRRHVDPPETRAERIRRSHFDLAGRGGRGRIVDENGDPLAGVEVRFQEIIWSTRSREDAVALGRAGGSFATHGGRVVYTPNRLVTTDAEGWFESPGTAGEPTPGDRRLVVIALIPGRRPFRATHDLGGAGTEPEFVVPVKASGTRVTLLLRGEPLRGLGLRIQDCTYGAQIPHGEMTTDQDGEMTADWFEDGRTYVIHGTTHEKRIYGAFIWSGQSEIETLDLLRNW